MAHLPQGTLVAIGGGKDIANPAAVIERLDKARAKYADMVLVHGGGPGVEKIAASWAERNGVHQIVCKPDWDRHGRAAPFRRNDELLNLLPKGVIAFPGSGITETSSTRRAPWASRCNAAPHKLQRLAGRVVASVAARPVSFPTDGVVAPPSPSRALRAALVLPLAYARRSPLRSACASRAAAPCFA